MKLFRSAAGGSGTGGNAVAIKDSYNSTLGGSGYAQGGLAQGNNSYGGNGQATGGTLVGSLGVGKLKKQML